MQIDFLNIILTVSMFLWFFSLGYLLFALIAVENFNYKKNKKTIMENFRPSVTILKPIYGLDPDMLDNLRSFCQQDYPQYQVIFGIQDKNDPALSIGGPFCAAPLEPLLPGFNFTDSHSICDLAELACGEP